jgi:hypothetical protein
VPTLAVATLYNDTCMFSWERETMRYYLRQDFFCILYAYDSLSDRLIAQALDIHNLLSMIERLGYTRWDHHLVT